MRKEDITTDPALVNDNNLVRILIVVEGTNDTEFLRRISQMLHRHDESLPNLHDMEKKGEAIFVPFGGGNVEAWTNRLAPLGKPEFHLFDHELPPETDYRREAAELINRRERCRAVLTRKRSLENYLHPSAIQGAGDVEVMFDDFDPVAEIVGRRLLERTPTEEPWEQRTRRARNRAAHRAKRWLNTTVADHMTVELLSESDPDREIVSWMRVISNLTEAG
ncbi:hypothetical protein Pan216_41300 [Planctomycetes bacterium Pan216]|uniref:ATP-dependent endonuclease n=1 Tax=Kolteria novifilia TaxID=2527975 RepID=A0A518B8I2_9BACT|nr:hypothetical protein Pan216_41300 [Planctomycetes bacterium Pan216]